MADQEHIEEVTLGIEMLELVQGDVVAQYRELAASDIGAAALQYGSFVAKLEETTHGGNAQVRSMVGGPLPGARAGLLDVLTEKYETASLDVRERICDEALSSLTRDNDFYVRMAVAATRNPVLVGDMIRQYLVAFPGADYYEGSFEKLVDAREESLEDWILSFAAPNFAATTLAYHTEVDENVFRNISLRHLELFSGAAHIMASRHDVIAQYRKLDGGEREEAARRWRNKFQPLFAEIIYQKFQEQNWIPATDPAFRR